MIAARTLTERASPDVSFVMAAFDAAPWIEAALVSALGQRGVTVEVIVVDDASRDDTAVRVAAFAARDPRVILIRRARGGGPSAARNLALERARGTWIAILDADDAVAPGRSRDLIGLAERSGCAVAADNVERFLDADPSVSWPLLTDLPPGSELRIGIAAYLDRNRLTGGASNLGYLKPIFSRTFLARHAIRYDERLRIGEDFDFCLRCLVAGTDLAVSGRAQYRYRTSSTSLSRRLAGSDLDPLLAAQDSLGLDAAADPRVRRADAAYRRSLREMQAYLALREHLRRGEWDRVLRDALWPRVWLAVVRLGSRAMRRRRRMQMA